MQGTCTSWTYYEYNAQGLCTLQRSGHAEEDADIINLYNTQRELVEQVDEYANVTLIDTDHNFINEREQKVARKITTDPLHNITEECYDTLGRLSSSLVKKNSQNTLLAATEYFYNGTNQKIKQIERVVSNGVIDHDYTITWEYDALDRIIKLVEEPGAPEEKVTSYTYDASGRVLTLTKPDGTMLSHTYDALGRLICLKSSDGTVSYAYTYDLNNNPLEVQDEVANHTCSYTYDAWNRTLTDGIKGRFTQSFTYDALGRLASLTAPDSSRVDYTYEESHLRNISWRGLEHHYNTFDKKGRPLDSTLIARLGTHSTIWDKKGRITNIASSYFTQEIPQDGFDAVGNLKKCFFTDAAGQVDVTADYDDLYQLTRETGVQEHSYTNDSICNRLSKNALVYTLDGINKLLSDAEHEFVYDKNGNLIEQRSRSKTIYFTYDALDRLIKVNDGTQQTSYLYDNFHRRIARTINGKKPQYFVHLGQREVGIWDDYANQLREYRVLGLGKGAEMGASIAIELDGKMYCPLHDHRGNIISLVDILTGKIAESYRYTAFGECETYNHKQQQIPKSAVNNSWGFASKRLDAETGFVYFSRRYYAPTIGRWITPDPLGFADGPNMYAYVGNNPMTSFDLYGLYVENESGDRSFDGHFEKRELNDRNFFSDTLQSVKDWARRTFSADGLKESFRETIKEEMRGDIVYDFLEDRINKQNLANEHDITLEELDSFGIYNDYFDDYAERWIHDRLFDIALRGKKPKYNGNKLSVNNQKLQNAAANGRAQHKKFAEQVKQKPGWQSEKTIVGPSGEKLRPDALTPSGRPVELKPKTPSGIKRGNKQLEKYEEATGKSGRVIYYDP